MNPVCDEVKCSLCSINSSYISRCIRSLVLETGHGCVVFTKIIVELNENIESSKRNVWEVFFFSSKFHGLKILNPNLMKGQSFSVEYFWKWHKKFHKQKMTESHSP